MKLDKTFFFPLSPLLTAKASGREKKSLLLHFLLYKTLKILLRTPIVKLVTAFILPPSPDIDDWSPFPCIQRINSTEHIQQPSLRILLQLLEGTVEYMHAGYKSSFHLCLEKNTPPTSHKKIHKHMRITPFLPLMPTKISYLVGI